ncbi:hypothetical protein DSCA_60790 [Desulfosarcina alkanivorans]|uniref:PilZ domain-containing protein n=1 Tax=Desulfosarcina alkanivorans TaxID=571177 RepID=A0A5K7YVS8_9BACT|nr:hypothetical protein [Desulfosarcina alkanivorans]BBO72149.1 hypothetical protein DSCA_60790 [Desulfosarcina alkanivorans]
MDPDWGKRRKRRFSVKDLTVSINGKTYRVFNINEYGLGFLMDSPEEIEIGARIEPMIVNGNLPVRVTGIPRHISQFRPSNRHLHFKSGWVCGTEFTTGHDRESRKLLREFIAENLDRDTDEAEK